MRECPVCFSCYAESVEQCPKDGRATFHSLPGDVALEGKYVLERRLGEGGMGIVYKAHHKFLKTTRAIKIIRRELVGNDPSFATRFHQEAMTAALIGHPNIISVPDFGFLEEKIPFIVMEFVEGISLQDLMTREGAFSPQRTLEYMRVITSAVSAAHAAGIVHRDLKPLNIMIQSGGSVREQIRILDFGLAKIKSDLFGSFVGAKTTGIIGSPYYMAPEQWSDEETDKRCDVYSLGIMLYQMLIGDVPFGGTGIPVIMKKHLMEPPPPMSLPNNGISPELEKVVHHALEKEPENRTPSAEAFIEELEKAVQALNGKVKPRRSRKAKAGAGGARRKNTEPGQPSQSESDSLGPSLGAISQQEQSAGGISGPELNTIVSPMTRGEADPCAISLKPSSALTQSESDMLRKAREEASRIAEERAIREFEESGEMPHVAPAHSLPRQPPPPTLPGRLAVGQHSAPGIFFRKRFVVPIVTAVVLVGVIVLATFMYVQSDPEQPVVATQPPTRTVKLRDMALIEGGEFTMGSNSAGGAEQKGEHRVTVPSFFIDKYEVTNADYAEFIKATGRPAPVDTSDTPSYWKPWNGNDPPAGRERWPVSNVSPRDAEAFAEWLSKRDGVKYRLPSEEEWEFAARNRSDGSLFPWGNSWDERKANLNEKSSPQNVGSFSEGVTKDGVYDMVGNVWEWTSSKASFYDGSRVKPEALNARVSRGGSYMEPVNTEYFQNSTSRNWYGDENFKYFSIGFRLVRNRE